MARPNSDPIHLSKLRDHFVRHRVLPSYAQIGALLGFRGKTGAFKLIGRLVESGHLTQVAGGKLAPTDRFFELPFVADRVSAGTGEDAAASGSFDHHELDRLLIEHPSRTILVTIRGDSMVEAGVLDGDTAVVERSESAQAGDFVAALVDGQCVVKELQYKGSQPILVPRNKLYQPIAARHDLQILGVVTGIVRRYERRKSASRPRGKSA